MRKKKSLVTALAALAILSFAVCGGARLVFSCSEEGVSQTASDKTDAKTQDSEQKGAKKMKKQTAGRDNLGELAPKFAELNDDVLFGEVWSREKELSPRDRSMITIAALFSAGQYPQLKAHLTIGKEHGVTKAEAVEIVTQLAFYCGWPKAWSTFPLIQEVYGDDEETELPPAFPRGCRRFPLENRTTLTRSILSVGAISRPLRRRRFRRSTLLLNLGAATTGTSIMRTRAEGKC